ncbi:MAG: NAD(P)/FAD-dependent oxidoreductase [Deltaproteobacteria bacterium]|nr:NAD(P)/FAD-dependent oxidoreductase [Deltaproteobacteria bacterium]MCB9786239.1 NAD(P)/FAD-dependent oxidoreductase [Deltaproteobacteria bacterium]
MSARWDVIIVGAGPAGTTAATLLAGAGHRVLVLEREVFPRFHIGESLLPLGLTLLDELGVRPEPQVFRHKAGARFVDERSGRAAGFDFSEALPGPPRHAWQVVRAGFDAQMRDRAEAAGAEIRHGQTVREVAIDADGVQVRCDSGSERGRYLVDATGQDRLLARRGRTVSPYKAFGKAAVFTHFEGLSDAAVQEIGPGGEIQVLIREDGWAWLIPLPGERLSVGVVSREATMEQGLLDALLQDSPLTRRLTAGAERGQTRVIGNFSFRNTAPHGARYACIGDASCFLDPVFSSGVSLALVSGARLARALSERLADGSEAADDAMAPLSDHMERGYRTFAALIHRFYNTRFIEHFLLDAPADGPMVAGVTSVLTGDVWREDNPFQRMLLEARQRR